MTKLHRTAATGALGLLAGAAMLATPAFACTPNARIQTTTTIGAAGDDVAVTGEQFFAGTTIELRWDTEDGLPLGSVAGPSFATQVQVPANATPGFHNVLAVQRAGFRVTRAQTFEVMASATPPGPVTPEPVIQEPVPGGPDATGPLPGGQVVAGPETPGPVTPGPVLTGPVTPGPATPGAATPAPGPSVGVVTDPRGSDRRSSIPAAVAGSIGAARALFSAPGTVAGERAGALPAPSAAAPDPATFWASPPSAGTTSADDLWSGLQAPPSLLSPGASSGRDLQTVVAAGLMGFGLVALAGTAGASAWRRLAISWARHPRT